jgi:hypothetical protein
VLWNGWRRWAAASRGIGLYTGTASGQTVEPDVQAILPRPYNVEDMLATLAAVLSAGPASRL